jgi:adenine-specific DNA-methyltransferase
MSSKQEARIQVQKLVEKYRRIAEAGKVKSYNEAQTRNEFIEPLFESLGWDMRNLTVDNEVTTEEAVSGGRVDLAFRFNNIPVMFLEAKAMKVDLDEWKWAEQAINYSWNKSVTWAILTDFESVKIFNAEIPPKGINDNLFIEIKWDEYLERFDQLWLLSKESFEDKLLDKEAEKWGKLARRKQVGEKLFEDLLAWRGALTREFKKLNELTEEELNEGVQRILDRLIFIRTAEDRSFEPEVLMSLYRGWETSGRKASLYHKLVVVFQDFGRNYDSKLFAPHYCETWMADDGVFVEIIKGLYGTKDGYRYDFSAISADVLGGIYEQYLGYVQSKSKNVAEKQKSKRKSSGIYYTPRYIVEYIVKETLGEVLKNTKQKDIPKIKVLDPACGSGSFLIAAYNRILSNIEKPSMLSGFQILKENLFGVDLDVQAVEIAQLNLLLKVLVTKTKLPTLSHNIRSGNSLISEGDENLKPFNFNKEFKDVFEQEGFDVIVGNPPYIKEDTNRLAFDGLHNDPYYQGKMDIWTLFACRAIDMLKEGGYFSFIAPSSWISSTGASIFRNKILQSGEIIKFIDFNEFRVFKEASIQTMIFVFQKKKPRKVYKVRYAKIFGKETQSEAVSQLLASGLNKHVENSVIFDAVLKPLEIRNKSISFTDDTVTEIISKVEILSNYKLSKNDIGNGIDVLQDFVSDRHLSVLKDDTIQKNDGVFVLKNSFIEKLALNDNEREYLKAYYTTAEINRYLSIKESEYKIIYADRYFREHIEDFPNLKAHIDRFKKILTSAFAPYGLHRPREESFFKGSAIFLIRKTMGPAFSYVDFPCYVTRAFLVVKPENIDLKYLTGLLNSKLIYFWLKHKGKKQGEQLQIDKEPLMQLPLIKADEALQSKIAGLVDKVTKCNADLHRTPADTDKWHAIKKEYKKLEEEIDQEIYNLYGLTEGDIKIIES